MLNPWDTESRLKSTIVCFLTPKAIVRATSRSPREDEARRFNITEESGKLGILIIFNK